MNITAYYVGKHSKSKSLHGVWVFFPISFVDHYKVSFQWEYDIDDFIHTYILYWLVPTGLFRVNFTLQQHNRIKNPNWQKATSWLFTSVAENLNSGRPSTNPASGQSGTRTRDRQIASPTRWPLGHAASLLPYFLCSLRTRTYFRSSLLSTRKCVRWLLPVVLTTKRGVHVRTIAVQMIMKQSKCFDTVPYKTRAYGFWVTN